MRFNDGNYLLDEVHIIFVRGHERFIAADMDVWPRRDCGKFADYVVNELVGDVFADTQ
jgi:hypothetical protein